MNAHWCFHFSDSQLTWQSNRVFQSCNTALIRYKFYRYHWYLIWLKKSNASVTTTMSLITVSEIPAAGATSPCRMLSTGSGSREPFFFDKKRNYDEYGAGTLVLIKGGRTRKVRRWARGVKLNRTRQVSYSVLTLSMSYDEIELEALRDKAV